MTSRKAKTEADKNAVALREIQSSCPENKKCFECEQRGPTYVNMTIGAFVCTKCSGVLRGINPPHRIKSISMSSFTSEEVEFIRGKGNVYCAKVWLGLYDKTHGYTVDLKDEDSIKDFIAQKYEKKRYYVDPSTIRHSLGSTASSISASSQQSSDVGSGSSVAPRSSGMIGTTIQLHNQKNRVIQRATPSSIPTASQSISNQVKSKSTNSSNNAAFAALAVPAPADDPFAPKQNSDNVTFASSATTIGFTTNFSNLTMPAASKAPVEKSESSGKGFTGDNFANFDSAVFESTPAPSNPAPQPVPSRNATTSVLRPINSNDTTPKAGNLVKDPAPTTDRYAALKDLDEIFKSTVAMNEGPSVKQGGTTGASLFGTSPLSAPVLGNRTATPPIQQNALGDVSPSLVGLGAPPPGSANSGSGVNWVASWPSPTNSSSANPSNGGDVKPSSSGQKSSSTPINPFTGATNLTQLNTSPWPTTGTSPVQTVAPPWPNNEDGFNGFSSTVAEHKGSVTATSSSGRQGYPDPFSSAPSFNQQQSDSTDLFAKAPKPNFVNGSTQVLSSSSELQSNTLLSDSKKTGSRVGIDPWAGMVGSPHNGQHKENIFTSSMMPSSNPNNPFL